MSAIAAARESRRAAGFAALQHNEFRAYVTGASLSMMADNIEHVISYWVLWEAFHAPMLSGFAVVSHWLPFLLFGVYFGSLADRHDCRRVIQVSQGLYMLVSLTWGVLFLTGTLQMWHAVALLTLHGLAGAIWTPAEQLMLHDIVGRDHLESAVRLNATGRQLGILMGPAVGGAILLLAGPTLGIWINALIYLPLSLSLLGITATGHNGGATARKLGMAQAWRTVGEAAGNRVILSMIAMAGVAALLIGSFTPYMPQFARDFGGGNTGLVYAALLLANGAGAVLGGLLLEATGIARVNVPTALASAALWGAGTAGFALTRNFPAALACLFLAGVAKLAFGSVAQTIVQLQAPLDRRGQLIGAFGMTQLGLMAGSGVTVGLVGTALGIHTALGWNAIAVTAAALGMLALAGATRTRELAYADATDGRPRGGPPECC